MKVLIIGQLPKEIGGNYTTGVANVVYELSKQKICDIEFYTFGTNISNTSAKKSSMYRNQYIGYQFNIPRIMLYLLSHPLDSLKHIKHYIYVDHQNFLRYMFYEDNIRNAIKIINPDIIHVNSLGNVSATKYALGKRRIPILLTCHGIFFRGNKEDTVNKDRTLGNIMLADVYSGLTKESLEEYESILGVPNNKVTIIPNGVDCKKFYFSQEDRVKIREDYGVNDYTIVFITVASLQKRKGQLDFLLILSQLDLDYQYWIVGKGDDEDTINLFVEEHRMQDKVLLLGYKTSEELYKYYSAADIYAHSSWKEGQALSELEANATGLRTIVNKAIVGTIASDISSDEYYIIDFDNVNLDSLSNWILKQRGKRQSRKTFDWRVIAEKYASLYKEILYKH